MPVYMILTGVPSNKQEEVGKGKKKVGKIPVKNISYIPVKGQIAVLKPIIDKISITYIIGDPDLTAAVVQNLLQEIEAGGYWQSGAFKIGSVGYKASAKLNIPSSGHTALVQAGPKKKTTTHTLRLEFNPAALGAPGIAFLKNQLETLVLDGLSFKHIITNGKVTRVDIAVDIVGVHLADLLVSNKGGGKHHWYYSEQGKPETGYLGMKKSDKNAKWAAYNKRQQVKDSPGAPAEQAFGGLSRTRIEYHAQPNKPFPALNTVSNPFNEISLAFPKAPKLKATRMDLFLRQLCEAWTTRRVGHVAGWETPKDLPTSRGCRACIIMATQQDMGSLARCDGRLGTAPSIAVLHWPTSYGRLHRLMLARPAQSRVNILNEFLPREFRRSMSISILDHSSSAKRRRTCPQG